uniref:Uncharacterized protein n=1 Tax=Helianthus annuus TaxID=4232 RepID=A0A251S3S9_HELAN
MSLSHLRLLVLSAAADLRHIVRRSLLNLHYFGQLSFSMAVALTRFDSSSRLSLINSHQLLRFAYI